MSSRVHASPSSTTTTKTNNFTTIGRTLRDSIRASPTSAATSTSTSESTSTSAPQKQLHRQEGNNIKSNILRGGVQSFGADLNIGTPRTASPKQERPSARFGFGSGQAPVAASKPVAEAKSRPNFPQAPRQSSHAYASEHIGDNVSSNVVCQDGTQHFGGSLNIGD